MPEVVAAVAGNGGRISGQGLQGVPQGTTLWSGSVALPPDRQPGEYRILVAERELLLSDRLQEFNYAEIVGPPEVPPPPRKVVIAGFYPPGTQRLVFAETLLT